MGSISGWGRSPGGGNGNPLQYTCLENPMDRGVWWATIHGSQNQMQLSTHTHKPFKGREGGWITKRNFYSQVSFIALYLSHVSWKASLHLWPLIGQMVRLEQDQQLVPKTDLIELMLTSCQINGWSPCSLERTLTKAKDLLDSWSLQVTLYGISVHHCPAIWIAHSPVISHISSEPCCCLSNQDNRSGSEACTFHLTL